MFCFSRDNHASTNLKKFLIWKLDTFTLFTYSLGKSSETCCVNFFRLSWRHFKRENPYFWKASLLQNKNWLCVQAVQDFATGKNFSFNQRTKQRVLLFSRESYSIKAKKKLFSCICIAWYKHSRDWENSRQLCKPSTSSQVCILTVSNFPNPCRVYIRLCKHGKRFLLLKGFCNNYLEGEGGLEN